MTNWSRPPTADRTTGPRAGDDRGICRPLPTLAADYPPGAAEETARLREAMRAAATAVNGHAFWSTVERERLVDARSALKQAARRTLGLPDPQ